MKKIAIKQGVTREDVLDLIDAATVSYMAEKRGLQEQDMRTLINKDIEVGGSYWRKIERHVQSLIMQGLPAEFFGRTA